MSRAHSVFQLPVCALVLLRARGGAAMLVPPTDPGLFFSPSNWHVTTTLASAINPGAYIKCSFRGTTSVALSVDAMPCLWEGCMTLAYTVDDGPMRLVKAPSHGGTVGAAVVLPLANAHNSTLNATKTHTLVLHIYNAIQYGNRWRNLGLAPYTDQRQALMVRGLVLDDGAALQPSALRKKRMIAFGDSITEGINAGCSKSGPRNSADAATKTWVQPVAAALDAEYGQVGFGRQGFTITGNGQVPPFFTPGVAVNSSWDKVYEGTPRSFKGLDFIFILHGTNDGLNQASCPLAGVVTSCEAMLHAIRAAAGPATAVFLVVPFGGFGAKNPPLNALPAAFAAYQKAKADPKTFLIDMGAPAAQGLECGGWMKGCVGAYGTDGVGSSSQGCDGIHPRGGTNATARHGELGAMLAVKAVLALAGLPALLD